MIPSSERKFPTTASPTAATVETTSSLPSMAESVFSTFLRSDL